MREHEPLPMRVVCWSMQLAAFRDRASFSPSISLERSKSVPPAARLFEKENTFHDTVGKLRTRGSQENEQTTTSNVFEYTKALKGGV